MANNQITIVHDLESLQQALLELAQTGKTVALVPTMGALHAGHASLIAQGADLADAVVVSIFANPRQFGVGEDFDRYPRTLEEDAKLAKAAGANIIYAPDIDDMYPQGFDTTVSAGKMGEILCGKSRVGHFDGVATVVTKLLLRVMPHVAIFGLKDYQQFCIIQRIVTDLDIPSEIIGAEIIRETDGLAMSSRNRYLSDSERKTAPFLYQTLTQAAQALTSMEAAKILENAIAELTANNFRVDYLEIFEGRLLVAAWLGNTRLIDNIEISAE